MLSEEEESWQSAVGSWQGREGEELGDVMKAPIKTGRKQRMKESHMKGSANHHSPESCLDDQQWHREALTGETTGAALNSEITQIRRQTLYDEGESNIGRTVMARYGWLRRSQRPAACADALYTGIGRPGKLPRQRQKVEGWCQ